ncbi:MULTISPECIES: hypothetical protein [unclassified Mesorhizobium]|uniref:hypothetical protein n=1 Tax=unclassified Mesorhizobium TaxID=325217 RepID=UPI0015E2EB79|nr:MULTISPECIES: hypothetical protein [unclassified Mesorhizobium]MBZ9919532.1 hypothetical protein [Mesorhizobium sp. BR1-1-7]MBZ9954380.1 hypothetical protein [Mesorhizobium sp. BR1-1-15]MBZ9969460.1 hypothetical protein [Mesorhizobium sp. BR1-1-12]MCA0000777.1 hypothetical protein [Mesorhizobium sp. B264B2A]MCA0004526.1 hypothetical protein [Mesorhizobium sp. B264B1B]
MNLSAPTEIVFIISLVIASSAFSPPSASFVHPLASVWTVPIAYLVRAGGCLMRGA